MLQSSSDIAAQPVLNFSNGNWELLITECTQLKTIVVTVYKPLVPNFALNKLAKVLDWIQKYITQKEDEENVRIILTVDFIFPPRLVEWVNSEEGVCQTWSQVIHQKSSINFSLGQIVNRSTREENTLDLVFTKDTEAFTDCRSLMMTPISDHKMVTFNITNTSGEHEEFGNKITPEISKWNFNNRDHVKWRLHLKKKQGSSPRSCTKYWHD